MDPALVLMLSSLLQLQQTLEFPTLGMSASPVPLLFMTLVTVLGHAAALYSETSGDDGDEEHMHFRSLITDQMWSLDPEIRDTQWRKTYGMSFPLYSILVDELTPHIQQEYAVGVHVMLPDAAVAMVLYRLAHGYNLRQIAAEYRLDFATITRYTNLVTKALATKLYLKYVSIPRGQRLLDILEAFRELTGLSNMGGAIDGTLVKLHRRPDKEYNPSSYRCRHHYFAVLLQVVCDHNKVFWDVCCKAPGGADDASHLRSSSLFEKLVSGQILVDSVRRLQGNHMRSYIVGDCSYPLLSFLLTPFTGNGTGNPAQNFFDQHLMQGTAVIQDAIATLKGRWKMLQNLNVGLNHASQTVVACCVLHNICMLSREPDLIGVPETLQGGPSAWALDNERSSNFFGESIRQEILEELQDRRHKGLL